ncbi:MAG: hypothetical protein KME19_25425 [Microcoleus vaginatus WJT46-NPBG5]|jgi:hypothetical protein|nr:hypothetical protein [Microcoleus vaginatus WJT46-NPBG5]
MAEQTSADYDNTFSLRPNRLGDCYTSFNREALYLKRPWRWSMPKNLEELRQDIKVELEKLTPPILASITLRHTA